MSNTASTPSEVSPKSGYHYGWVMYFIIIHVVSVYGVYYTPTAAWQTNVFSVSYYFYGHLSITILAHRYYAHKTFQFVAVWLHYVFLFGFCAVVQGPILWWAGKHMAHHTFADQPGRDPHTPNDGFWWAHMGWLLSHQGLSAPRQVTTFLPREGNKEKPGDPKMRFAPGRWQSASPTRAFFLGVFAAFVVPTLICSLWGDPLGGLLVGGFARLLFQYHFTWIVNSLGHYWGEREGGSSTNQVGVFGKVLAVMTVGESNHAGHHSEALHYRIGRKPGQIDPGAWVIERLAWLGLVSDLKGASTTT